MRIAAGITTCNEEQTIGPLLRRLLEAGGLTSVTVVSSACSDRTEEIVLSIAATDPRVKLISEPARRGKSAAVNTFLASRPESDLTLIASGDILPEKGAVDAISRLFSDPKVGMAGGRPVPENEKSTLTGMVAHLTWNLHHRVALLSPKLGEMTMFRSALVVEIPAGSTVDEASIESRIHEAGYCLAYAPKAVIHNRGPDTFRELISRRRSNAYGHRELELHDTYQVSTRNNAFVARALVAELCRHPSYCIAVAALVGVEIIARFLAMTDRVFGRKNLAVWKIAPSTKKLNGNGAA